MRKLLLSILLGLTLSLPAISQECVFQTAGKSTTWGSPEYTHLGKHDFDNNGHMDEILYHWNPTAGPSDQWLSVRFNYRGGQPMRKQIRYRIPYELQEGFAISLTHMRADGEEDRIGITFQMLDFYGTDPATYRVMNISDVVDRADNIAHGTKTYVNANQVAVEDPQPWDHPIDGPSIWTKMKKFFSDLTDTPRWYQRRYEIPSPGSVLRYVQISTPWIFERPQFHPSIEYRAISQTGSIIGIGHLGFCGTLGADPYYCSSSEIKEIYGNDWTKYHYWLSVPCGNIEVQLYHNKWNNLRTEIVGEDIIVRQRYKIPCTDIGWYPTPRG